LRQRSWKVTGLTVSVATVEQALQLQAALLSCKVRRRQMG